MSSRCFRRAQPERRHRRFYLIAAQVLSLLAIGVASPAAAQDSVAVVNEGQVQVRDTPAIGVAVLFSLARGDTVLWKGRLGYWSRVVHDGRLGYVRTAQLGEPMFRASTTLASRPSPTATTQPARPASRQRDRSANTDQGVTASGGDRDRRRTPRAQPAFRVEVAGIQEHLSPPDGSTTPGAGPLPDDGRSGTGFDVQFRVSRGAFSLGAGYMRAFHQLPALTEPFVWSGPFLEPRLAIPVTRAAELTLGFRGGLLPGSVSGAITDGGSISLLRQTVSAQQVTGLLGLRLHLARTVSADVGVGLGVHWIGTVRTAITTSNGSQLQESVQREVLNRTGNIRIVRVGLSIGLL